MKKIKYSGVRSSIAQYVRLARGFSDIALNVEIRAAALQRYCRENGMTYTPLLLKVIARVARQYPIMNGILARDVLRKKIFIPDQVDIAIALEKTHGGETFVTSPVVRDVGRKSVAEVGADIQMLVETPFDKRPDIKPILLFNRLPEFLKYIVLRIVCQSPRLFKLFFGTIGFTNLGKFGIIDILPAWVNTVVFAVGSLEDRPVARDGRVVVEPVLHVTLMFNHSVLDGAEAGRVLTEFRRIIETGEFAEL